MNNETSRRSRIQCQYNFMRMFEALFSQKSKVAQFSKERRLSVYLSELPDHVHLYAARRTEYARVIKQRMREAIRTACEKYPDVVNTTQTCLESFIKAERSFATSRYPREHYVHEQHCLVAIDYSDRIAKKRFNFLDAREDLGNLAVLCEDMVNRDLQAATASLRLFRMLLQMISELAALIEDLTRVERTNWQAVLDAYVLPTANSEPSDETAGLSQLLPRLGQITEVKMIGAGGFGAVYNIGVGSISLIGKLVPIGKFKTLKQACADKIVGSLVRNPLLVQYHACYQTSQAYVTIMEYIRGVDLQRVIVSRMALLEAETNKLIMAQLGLALQYLHYRGFIHRDIKPSNVMVMPGCRAKLIDFDTCKVCVGRFLSGNQNSFIRRTFVEFNDGELAGTLYFLPPEILRKKPYGRAMDWWAVGVTSYQLCTGKLPFRGSNEKAVKDRIKRAQVKFNSGEVLHQDFTCRLLAKFPTQRITSARFEEFKNHKWLATVNWERLLTKQGSIRRDEFLPKLFEFHNGVYSPKMQDVAQKYKDKKLLKFSQLTDLPPHEQEPLCTFLSRGFEIGMRKALVGESLVDSDIEEAPDFADTNMKFSKYKFLNFLIARSGSSEKRGAPLECSKPDAETFAYPSCSIEEGNIEVFDAGVEKAPQTVSTTDDEHQKHSSHQQAQLSRSISEMAN